jgi:hypothetical protein
MPSEAANQAYARLLYDLDRRVFYRHPYEDEFVSSTKDGWLSELEATADAAAYVADPVSSDRHPEGRLAHEAGPRPLAARSIRLPLCCPQGGPRPLALDGVVRRFGALLLSPGPHR